jgi:hypothetical protein
MAGGAGRSTTVTYGDYYRQVKHFEQRAVGSIQARGHGGYQAATWAATPMD